MNEDVACRAYDLTTADGGQVWQKLLLGSGGTYEVAWDAWLRRHERAVWEPLLTEAYVLDIDNTIKPLYGHQEGAELGYNPQKPGRPSHNYHTYFILERAVLSRCARANCSF